MPLYYFALKTEKETFADRQGHEFAGDAEACAHGTAVAQELMRNRERDTRFWSVVVYDDYLQPRTEIFFATVDRTIGRLPPAMHVSVEGVCRTVADLRKAIDGVEATLCDLRQTLDRADKLLAVIS